jgi:hypothetical protein
MMSHKKQSPITQNEDGTYSWTTPGGQWVKSTALPYEDTVGDRTLIGYAILSYSLWGRTILRELWLTYRTTPVPQWMKSPKARFITLD